MTEAVKQQIGKFMFRDVRLAFPNLFEPRAAKAGQKAKYSTAMIYPRTHPQLPELQKLVQEVAAAKWGDKAEETLKSLKASDRLCVHDGDAKNEFPGYAGNLYSNASNEIRPLVIGGGPDGKAPLAASDGKPYSGCYANVIVQVWAQQHAEHGKRINMSLLGVQFLRDGERLAGGGVAAADDFEPIPQAAADKAAAGGGAASLF